MACSNKRVTEEENLLFGLIADEVYFSLEIVFSIKKKFETYF